MKNSSLVDVSDYKLKIADEILHLLPERALFWPRTQTLFIADPHLGKVATFRTHAIPLPEGNTAADLQRLGQAIDRTGATKLMILGDLFHTARGRADAVVSAVTAWREQYAALAIYLVAATMIAMPVTRRLSGALRSPTAQPPVPTGC
jgi:hypothetical protein